jgi:hypothetical protein
VLRYGYDAVRLDPLSGPLDGGSALFELGGGWLPTRHAVHGFARAELGRWWQISGRTNLMFRLAGAATVAPDAAGRNWERTWWLSSADNLRGYTPADTNYLIGQNYWVSNLELHIPFDSVIRFFLFDHIAGVAAFDFGGVFNQFSTRPAQAFPDGSCFFSTTRHPDQCISPGAWDSRTLTGVLGINALFGPILMKLHFGHPYDIHGLLTPALATHDHWVTNFSLRFLFF